MRGRAPPEGAKGELMHRSVGKFLVKLSLFQDGGLLHERPQGGKTVLHTGCYISPLLGWSMFNREIKLIELLVTLIENAQLDC